MYTVVIADDEEEIRRTLIKKVDWQSLGFELVGEAENGVEALELVEKLEPDLLLTDIKMPFITGIELARQIREIRPMIQIAFLSGYDDFLYAQQAIQYNVISYILKPVSSEEIIEELIKIRQKIDEKFQLFEASEQLQEENRQTEFLLPLLLDAFVEESGEEWLKTRAVSCGVLESAEGSQPVYTVLALRLLDPQGENVTDRANTAALDTIMSKYFKHASVMVQDRIVSLLMGTPIAFERYLHILVQEVSQSVKRILGWECRIGVSRGTGRLGGCHEAYLEAMHALSYAKQGGGNIHFISDEERTEADSQELLHRTVEEIENMLRIGTKAELVKYLEQLFFQLDHKKLSREMIHMILHQVVSAAMRVVYTVVGIEAVYQMLNQIGYSGLELRESAPQMQQYCRDACLAARELIARQRQSSSEELCGRALEVIKERYSDPTLSLAMVSREISASPNYLSGLIKKNTGSTFTDLLTTRRIEAAKELLLGTAMKVKEISERCGYSDQHYFSYCFKKYTGLSPNQCRRQNEN